jgi:hypothetical protein
LLIAGADGVPATVLAELLETDEMGGDDHGPA